MSKIVTANLALYILISLLLFSFSVQDVSAQCMVGGHVYNKGGAVIEGATIRILSRQDSILAQTITDSLGRFFLVNFLLVVSLLRLLLWAVKQIPST